MKFFLFIQIKTRLIRNQIKVIYFYYRNKKFLQIDCFLFLLYLFSNPYRICRKFLEGMGYGNIHSYGETPLPALEKIVRAFDITSAEKWLEIGSGRGRGCFWISEVWGCRARGIEWVPTFVSKASWIAERIPSCLSQFEEISMYDADFSWPDVVYLCGTCMNSQEIKKLLCSMRILQKGAKVITISEPFNHPDYQLVKSISVSFIWGDTEAYLQIKKAPSK